MCVGCHILPMMASNAQGSEPFLARTVSYAYLEAMNEESVQVQPQMSAAQVRFEILTLIQHLPEWADVQLTQEMTAIHQRLADVTHRDEANKILGIKILEIAERLDKPVSVIPVVHESDNLPELETQEQPASLLLQGQQTWGWLS